MNRLVCFLLVSFAACSASADEGMWLLNRPPLAALKQRYGFEPPPGWLDDMQKCAVNFGGASGSLVSSDGLVLTNHHVGSGALAELSTEGHDLRKDGFYAGTPDAELRCPGMELKILWSIDDVTGRVTTAPAAGMNDADANTARRKAIIAIEKVSQEQTGLLSRVVTLYNGARYHLYRFKRYTDVRLVFSPEEAIAFFGGDTDNFEYPRYDLDMCIFRIYENGKPFRPEHYLRLGSGAAEGDLAFVFGHPGRTERLNTVDHLKYLRDTMMPNRLQWIWQRQAQVEAFSDRSDENARIARGEDFGVRNSRKAYAGRLAALQDPGFMAKKTNEERQLRSFVASDPRHREVSWEKLADALARERNHFAREQVIGKLESHCELAGIAMHLVRLADELSKPNGDRLPEYSDAHLPTLYTSLYSDAPIYDSAQIERLSCDLSFAAAVLGGDDPLVVTLLAGKSPLDRAGELVRGCRLKDVAVRKAMVAGGKPAVDRCADPMIRYATLLDPMGRLDRKRVEDELEAIERDCYAKIASAQFAMHGEEFYPDATGTLRLSFGAVKGYAEESGPVSAFTSFSGLFDRAAQRGGRPPFALPRTWIDAREHLDPMTPFDFVLTADIIGGNSGSPVVNRKGELIGLIFDGNLEGLAWDYQYDDACGRAVAVDVRAIVAALRNVYHADRVQLGE